MCLKTLTQLSLGLSAQIARSQIVQLDRVPESNRHDDYDGDDDGEGDGDGDGDDWLVDRPALLKKSLQTGDEE